jgi:hypothetical protein
VCATATRAHLCDPRLTRPSAPLISAELSGRRIGRERPSARRARRPRRAWVVVSWLVCVGVGGDCQGGFTCLESWLVGGSVGRSIRKDGKFRGSDGSGRACLLLGWGLRVSVPGVRFCVLV